MVCELEISDWCDRVSGERRESGDRPLARPIFPPPQAPLGRWERPSAERNGPGGDQPGLTPWASIKWNVVSPLCSAGPPLPMVLTDAVPVSPLTGRGVVWGVSRVGSAVSTADFCPTPGPARPLEAAERRTETTGVPGGGGRRKTASLWARHAAALPCPYGSKNEVPTSCKTAGLATA